MKFLILFLIWSTNLLAATKHELLTQVNPKAHTISVIDTITLANEVCNKDLIINLHSGLKPKITNPIIAKLEFIDSEIVDELHKLSIERFKINLPCNSKTLTLEYSGEIFHEVTDPIDPYSRGTSDSPGLISDEGVVLSSGTFWYPKFENINDEYVTFNIRSEIPNDFSMVSQGKEILGNQWEELSPQQDIYLIAARFTKYEKTLSNGLKISAFLRTRDDDMANRYMDVTSTYIERYNNLIGPYPYAKFALVENFWDTGFGMPSFTLLGSNIIRLPFIINTSYPHEILHDWWGNSVYVDYNSGNWCEGITAYLADHLMAEMSGNGENYRRDTLQKFTDYVTAKTDFPLNQFHERHDAASEAIGYGKSLMLFHMLRQSVGDNNFKNSFKDFYAKNIFKEASFNDIKKSFENISGLKLTDLFSQWVNRTGAPTLKISEVTSTPNGNGFNFHAKISQVQKEDAFSINLPFAISLDGQEIAFLKTIKMDSKELDINLFFNSRPTWFQADPAFDIFRRLSSDEVPAVLTMALGSQKTLLVLPSSAGNDVLTNWNNFINIIKPALPKESEINIVLDNELSSIPNDRTIWVLGKENALSSKFSELLKDQSVKMNNDGLEIDGKNTFFKDHSFTLIARDKKNLAQIWTFIATDSEASFPILANKLIHYGKYSYLGFEGDSVTNKLKGIWKLTSSSMSVPVSQTDGVFIIPKIAKLNQRGALVNE